MTSLTHRDPIRGIDVPRLQPASDARCPSCSHGAFAGAPPQRVSHLPFSHSPTCPANLDEHWAEDEDRAEAVRLHERLAAASPGRADQPWGAVVLRDPLDHEVAGLAALGHEVDRRFPVRVDVVDGVRTRTFALRDGSEVAW